MFIRKKRYNEDEAKFPHMNNPSRQPPHPTQPNNCCMQTPPLLPLNTITSHLHPTIIVASFEAREERRFCFGATLLLPRLSLL